MPSAQPAPPAPPSSFKTAWMAPARRSRRKKQAPIGTANAARVSKGSFHDTWVGLGIKKPKRHPTEHITVTCVIYNTIEGGVPSEADVIAAIDDMEQLYTACGQGKSGRLADAGFDFMKKELTTKDLLDAATANPTTAEPTTTLPPEVTNHDVFPGGDEGGTTTEGAGEMEQFLALHALSQYSEALEAAGWDDLNFLKHASEDVVRSAAVDAKMKPGHTAKFLHLLTN